MKYFVKEDQARREKTYYYINEVYSSVSTQYGRESHAEKSIYDIDINLSPGSIPNCNFVLGGCVIYRRMKIPEE